MAKRSIAAIAAASIVRPNRAVAATSIVKAIENAKPVPFAEKIEKLGRKSISEMSAADVRAEIDELLNDLRTATRAGDKKLIRAQLRRRGHTGGLRSVTTVTVAPPMPATPIVHAA